MANLRHIVVVGNGIAGVTAARHIRKLGNDRITIISGESDHPFSRPALMYIFMRDLNFADTKLYEDGFWAKNRIELRRDWVEQIDTAAKRLRLRGGESLSYDALIVATGSVPAREGWPGEELEGVQSLCSLQDVELLERNAASARRAVIVGGGLIGIELAEMLVTRGIAVTMLIRERFYWSSVLPDGEAEIVTEQARAHGIDLQLDTQLSAILPGSDGRVRAVTTAQGTEIPCEIVGICTGVRPRIDLATISGIECNRGILVDRHFRTSASDVYAGGDCAEHRDPPTGRKAVEQVWYTAKIHGETIGAHLMGQAEPYCPGIWFNSAKFFDLEYQTYGDVPRSAPEGVHSFFWRDTVGRRCLRVNFHAGSGAVLGVNVFGLRHRHAVWEEWITSTTHVREVMAHLAAANFDPEFFCRAEPEIVAAFNRAHPSMTVELKSRRGLFSSYIRSLFQGRRDGADQPFENSSAS